jgi:four helix bundle protein
MKAQSYQDLILWQKAMDLAELIYKSTSGFTKEEIYGITSQMRRSAISIPSNIAEGRSRNTKGEFLQFLGISKGSLSELETQVLLSVRLNYLTVEQSEKILSLSSEVGKLITSFQLKLKNSTKF